MIRGHYSLAPLIACTLSISSSPANDQKPRLLQQQGNAKLLSVVPVDEATLRIALADGLPLTVEIEAGSALEVKVPRSIVGGVWREAARSPVSRMPLKNKTLTWQQTFSLVV